MMPSTSSHKLGSFCCTIESKHGCERSQRLPILDGRAKVNCNDQIVIPSSKHHVCRLYVPVTVTFVVEGHDGGNTTTGNFDTLDCDGLEEMT
jgi:hypothetical protein